MTRDDAFAVFLLVCLTLGMAGIVVGCSRDGAPAEMLYGARGVPYASGWRCTVEEHKSPTYYVKKTECWK